MNANEGISMVKMSVAVLMLVLLIGAIMGMFYYMSDSGYKAQKHMENAASSGKADNLFDLTQYTRDTGLIPVPTAVSAITEFEDQDLLYVRVCVLDKDGKAASDEVYIPQDTDYTFTTDSNKTVVTYNKYIRFVNTACRRLLQYSDNKCQVIAEKVSSSDLSGVTVNSSTGVDGGMLGVSVIIHESR